MKKVICFTLLVCIGFTVFLSCSKDPFAGFPTTHIDSIGLKANYEKSKYQLNLNYPSVSTPGTSIKVKATTTESLPHPFIIKWFSGYTPFTMSFREMDILGTGFNAVWEFSFPELPEGTYFFIRCEIHDGETVIQEKNIMIESRKG